MNIRKTAIVGVWAVLVTTASWAAEPIPTVNLVGRPVPKLDSLPEGPYRALVLQDHELCTRTFAVIGPEVKDLRKRYAGNNLLCIAPGAVMPRRATRHRAACQVGRTRHRARQA